MQQNVRHSGSGEPVVQFGSDAIVDADGSGEDTSREAQTESASCVGQRRTPLGNLAVPFMRAALVITVDQDHCAVPSITPARARCR